MTPEGAEARGKPGSSVEVVFPSSPAYLPLVRSNVRWVCEKSGFPENDCCRIVLAVVEAVTNVIRHAYSGDSNQSILLRITELPDGIELELLDRGESVAPSSIGVTDDERESRPGGLGVHLMKACVDHFHYEPRPDGGARLILRKIRGGDEGRGGEEE